MSTIPTPLSAKAGDVIVALPPVKAENGQSVVLHDVAWDQYCDMLEARGDRRFRHTYDSGTLEIMTPSFSHDADKSLLGRLLERMTEELGIEIKALGSTTQRRQSKERGFEPDECYYIENEERMRGRGMRGDELDLSRDPAPDLVIEIDVTSSSMPRLPVFAAIGVKEVWRFDGKQMLFYSLEGSSYQEIERSKSFPFLPPQVLQEFLLQRATKSDLQVVRGFVAWVREATA